MKGSRRWAAFGVTVMLVGLLALQGSGGKAEPPASPSLATPRHMAAPIRIASNAQVTRTPIGLWITYTEDGEGNPLNANDFALDITTGDMWFRNGVGLLTELSAAGEWTTYDLEDFGYEPPRPRWITDVAVDEEGNTWMGMCFPNSSSGPPWTGGVVMIAPDGSWTDYTDQLDRCVFEVLADRTGNKWFFENHTITRFDGENQQVYPFFQDYVIEQHYEEVLETIDRGYRGWYVEAPNRVWCPDWRTGRGARVYDGSGWATHTSVDGLADDAVVALGADDEGIKWFSTRVAVSVLDDKGTLGKDDDEWAAYDLGLLSGHYEDIAVDQEGKIWLGTSEGLLFMWNDHEWTWFDSTNSGLPPFDWIVDVFVDDRDVKWFGTSGGLTLLIERLHEAFLPLVTR